MALSISKVWRKMLCRHSDPFRFALLATAASLLALATTVAMGIDHPWWAAMTVVLVAQPTRGLLLERALARLAGTAIGGAAGYWMLKIYGDAIPATLTALALWLGLCAAGGSMVRHFRTYAFVLAGYSAAIIILFRIGNENAGPMVVGDRLSATLVGVAFSSLVALGAPSKSTEDAIATQFALLVDRVLDQVEACLRNAEPDAPDRLIGAIARFEEQTDALAAGSVSQRLQIRQYQRLSPLLVQILHLAYMRRWPVAFEKSEGAPGARIAAFRQIADAAHQNLLSDHLGTLARFLENPDTKLPRFGNALAPQLKPALAAAARPMLALTLASALWLATGWEDGPMVAMTATIFACLFSSHKDGGGAMAHVLIGSCCGTLIGAVYRACILPAHPGLLESLLIMLPVMFANTFLMRIASTQKMAIDLTMCFLLVSQPFAPAGSDSGSWSMCLAILCGVVIAWVVLHQWRRQRPDCRAGRTRLSGAWQAD